MAVLFRINAQSPAIEQALADRQVPYLVRGGERFYERAEVRQALLTLRTEARAMTGEEGGSAVDQMKAVLGVLGWTPTPPDGAGAVRERWESLAALLTVAEDLVARPGDGTALDLRAVSAELDARAEAQHVPVAQGVTVSTLHSAKGLEWESVALLGVQEGSLPFVLATRPEQVEEERRLLYVGRDAGAHRAAGLLVAHPQRRRQHPQALPLPRPGAAATAPARRAVRARRPAAGGAGPRCCRSTAAPAGWRWATRPSARSAAT